MYLIYKCGRKLSSTTKNKKKYNEKDTIFTYISTYPVNESPFGPSDSTSPTAGEDIVSPIGNGPSFVTVRTDETVKPNILGPHWPIVESETLDRSPAVRQNSICIQFQLKVVYP